VNPERVVERSSALEPSSARLLGLALEALRGKLSGERAQRAG